MDGQKNIKWIWILKCWPTSFIKYHVKIRMDYYGYQVIPYFSSLTQKSYSNLLPFGSLHLSPSSTYFGSMRWLYAVIGWFSQNGHEILIQVFPHLLQLHKRVISGHPQHTLSLEPSNDSKLLLQKVFYSGIYCCYEDTIMTVDVSNHFFLDWDSQGIVEISKSNNPRKVTNTQSSKCYICFAKYF